MKLQIEIKKAHNAEFSWQKPLKKRKNTSYSAEISLRKKKMAEKKTFIHSIRVYIEDTDAAGIVYHPNHLKFFERARTEMLRDCGFTKTRLEQEEQLLFVIKEATVDFKAPAFMDDLLDVHTALEKHKATRFYFTQEIYRSQTLIASAKMTIVCVNKNYKPSPLPPSLVKQLTKGNE